MLSVDPVGISTQKDNLNQNGLLNLQENGRPAQTSIKSPAGKGGVNLTLNADDNSFLNAYADKKRTAQDVMLSAEAQDVKTDRDRMVVMRSTMTEEDFHKAMEDGFDFKDMTPEEAVTILDRIKIDVALGGTEIKGFTDTVDEAAIKEITGSEALANELKAAFAKEDIPLTKDNAQNVMEALHLAEQIEGLSDGTIRYMTENNMDATVKELYLASHSTNGLNSTGGKFYAQEGGYYAERAQTQDLEQITPQVKDIVAAAGYDAEDDAVTAKAFQMIEEGLPLTKENFARVMELNDLQLPLKEKDVVDASAHAIAQGEDATQAQVQEKPPSLHAQITAMSEEELTALKTLEETRFLMISEANRSLMSAELDVTVVEIRDKIVMIEEAIAQIKEQIAALEGRANKEILNGMQQSLIPDALRNDSVTAFFLQKQALYTETLQRINIIETAPAAVVGELADELFGASLETVSDKAYDAKVRWSRAGATYEALMTAPRADLGDSIKKAFRNVDDILADMNREPSEENRRAIRILGYNRMEMTEENFEKVRAADAKLTALMERLRPAAVLNMIREGKNPLAMTVDELDEYLTAQEMNEEVSDEKYAKFLYKLEHNNAITEAERESFIGIYRLFHTLKKTDDAAIGMLLNTGTEMTVKNLLTATRTNAKTAGGIDVRADATFAGVDGTLKTKDIAVQIETAFVFYKAQADLVYEKIEPEKLHAMQENPEEALLTSLAHAMQDLPVNEALEGAYRKELLEQLRAALPKKDTKTNRGALEKSDFADDKLTETRRIATLRQHLLFLTEEHERK